MALLGAHDVPAAAVNSIPEAMNDVEVRHLDVFHDMVHPLYGKQTLMHRSTRIDGEREADPTLPPVLGEHTEQILGSFGLTAQELESLRAEHVI